MTSKFGTKSQLLHVYKWYNFEIDSFGRFKFRKINVRSSFHLYKNSMDKARKIEIKVDSIHL